MDKLTWLVLFGIFAIGSTHHCHMNVNPCFQKLIYYDANLRPNFRMGPTELDETCNDMTFSFDCVDHFIEACNNHSHCNETCQERVEEVITYLENSGLREIKDKLCDPNSELRQDYLNHAKCIDGQMNEFSKCSDIMRKSNTYIETISDKEEQTEKFCCAATRFRGCVLNVTVGRCDPKATRLVSTFFNTLVWKPFDNLCKLHAECSSPLTSPPTTISAP